MTFLALLILALCAGQAARWRLAREHRGPGQFVSAGGHRLHVQRTGAGPTVVFDAGAGGTGLDWDLVRRASEAFATTVAYDRAGLGWSDRGPKPRTLQVHVTELRSALQLLDADPPYVFVGHSYGALVGRAYAYEHADEVAGLVLVDAAHEDQYSYYPEEYVRRGREMARSMRLMGIVSGAIIGSGLPALFAGRIPDPVADRLPSDVARDRRALAVVSPKHMRTVTDEFVALDDSLSYLRRIRRPLGHLPVVVITHGIPVTEGVPQHLQTDVENAWQKMQADLASISTNASLIVAEGSGHNVPVEQPQTIVDAIRDVLSASMKLRRHGAGNGPDAPQPSTVRARSGQKLPPMRTRGRNGA